MPDLGRFTPLQDVDKQRYIRIKTRIIYHDDPRVTHESLAYQQGVTETGARNKLVVDDAGYFAVIHSELTVDDDSATSVVLRGDKNTARHETKQLIKLIRG